MTIYVPYDGVVKELMYEVDDVATKGKPLMLIEVEGDVEAKGTFILPSLILTLLINLYQLFNRRVFSGCPIPQPYHGSG